MNSFLIDLLPHFHNLETKTYRTCFALAVLHHVRVNNFTVDTFWRVFFSSPEVRLSGTAGEGTVWLYSIVMVLV